MHESPVRPVGLLMQDHILCRACYPGMTYFSKFENSRIRHLGSCLVKVVRAELLRPWVATLTEKNFLKLFECLLTPCKAEGPDPDHGQSLSASNLLKKAF